MAIISYSGTGKLQNFKSKDQYAAYLEELQMEYRIPKLLWNDFWLDFIDALKKEYALLLQEIGDIKEIWNANIAEEDRLVEINDVLYGFVDRTIGSTITYLRQETKNIDFKLKYKNTIPFFNSIAKSIGREAILGLYYFDGTNLVRNSEDLLADISGFDITNPYRHKMKENFTGLIAEDIFLDTGLFLDDDLALDTQLIKQNTKHLSLEYYLDTLIEEDGNEYLMNETYFSYLYNGVDSGRKVTDVFHVGTQLNCLCDSGGSINTITDLDVKTILLDTYTGSNTFANGYIKFGTSKHLILTSTLTDINDEIAFKYILNDEKFDNDIHEGYIAEYKGQLVKYFATLSSSISLEFTPIRFNTVKITFNYLFGEYELTDDYGRFDLTLEDTEKIEGTIDYSTGEIEFTTLPPNPITNVEIEYYTFQSINITEAGLFDDNDDMIAYASFPAIEFRNFNYHVNLSFIYPKII